jgi:hypothetical protein
VHILRAWCVCMRVCMRQYASVCTGVNTCMIALCGNTSTCVSGESENSTGSLVCREICSNISTRVFVALQSLCCCDAQRQEAAEMSKRRKMIRIVVVGGVVLQPSL